MSPYVSPLPGWQEGSGGFGPCWPWSGPVQLWCRIGKEIAGNRDAGSPPSPHTLSGIRLVALRQCSEVSSQERSLRPVPGWAPERDVPSSQLLLQRGFDYIWRRLFTSSFGAAMSARPGRLMPKEGTRTGKGTSSPWLPAVLLPASPPTCLPLPDFFQACFLSAADSSGNDKQRASCNADHLRGCRSPPRCTAAHAAGLGHGHSARWARGGESRAETPHRSKPAVPQPRHLHRSSPAPAARAQPGVPRLLLLS